MNRQMRGPMFWMMVGCATWIGSLRSDAEQPDEIINLWPAQPPGEAMQVGP